MRVGSERAEKQRAWNEFGTECVVCESKCRDLHHIDEDTRHKRWTNRAPVCPTLNEHIQRVSDDKTYGRLSLIIPTDHASPGTLSDRGDDHFRKGRFRRAYVCYRLGAYIARKYLDKPNEALILASKALYSLRPAFNMELAVEVLRKEVKTLLADSKSVSRLTDETKLFLCREIGALYFGETRLTESEVWLERGLRIARNGAIPGDGVKATLGRTSQHKGFVDLFRMDATGLKHLERADDLLGEAGYFTGPANNAQHRAFFYIKCGEIGLADREFERLFLHYSTDLRTSFFDGHLVNAVDSWGPWLGCGLALCFAELLVRQRKPGRAKSLIDSAITVMQDRGIRTQGPIVCESTQRFCDRYGRTLPFGLADRRSWTTFDRIVEWAWNVLATSQTRGFVLG